MCNCLDLRIDRDIQRMLNILSDLINKQDDLLAKELVMNDPLFWCELLLKLQLRLQEQRAVKVLL